MIFANSIIGSNITAAVPLSATIKSSFESAATNDCNVYYRINSGSWVLAGQVSSTSCDTMLTVNNIVYGSIIEIVCEEDITNLGISYNAANSSSCPSPSATYCGDRSSGYYFSLVCDSNEDVSITVSVSGGAFNYCS